MHAEFIYCGTTAELSWRYTAVRGQSIPFHWHFHPEYELVMVTEGTGTRFVGDCIEPYRAGDLMLVGSDLPHSLASTSSGRHETMVVHFAGDFLGLELFERPDFAAVGQLLGGAGRGLVFEESGPVADALGRIGSGTGPQRTLDLLGVLVALSEGAPGRPLASVGHRPHLPDNVRDRMNAVFEFVHAEYTRPLRLADVANVAHLSPEAFSRFFRRCTGRTLTSYLAEYRIGAACRALIETDRSVTDIASASGFGNLSNFNRRFRALKAMSPREYRAKFPGS